MRITFWGVRGSIASPGPDTAAVGGNTSCVEVRCGDARLILDAGTGLRRLGDSLLGEGPVFAGDAVADPMTGTHAALAALSHWAAGHSGVVELSMYDVVHAARTPLPESHVVRRGDDWYVDDGSELHLVRRPVARQAIR